ncbi:hypothetical protein MAPG_10927 [Magnaporthiopsis poae ATCC 64411]|uniref:Uncharacterized protein n=1 Tax=Magnaporthiopsis poae (strain ATCC 64411 / 73-15) TaxID=644358 RepID=A0A0C4EDW7_MAGP6|nr:hypothetical protein MAPG_10927 [Magnaporthiopsis poae ATCC 64411]
METTTAPPPTPRQMLTSLINSISSIPLSEPDGDGDGKPSSSPASPSSSPDANSNNNPKASQQRTQNHSAITKPPATGGGSGLLLHHRMASYRPLLTTLHALFPTLLLAALDLLDRGLHLLACLLADRWPVARRCVVEKHVSREELAGVMAGI